MSLIVGTVLAFLFLDWPWRGMAIGALAAGVPAWLAARANMTELFALRAMFVLHAAIAVAVW